MRNAHYKGKKNCFGGGDGCHYMCFLTCVVGASCLYIPPKKTAFWMNNDQMRKRIGYLFWFITYTTYKPSGTPPIFVCWQMFRPSDYSLQCFWEAPWTIMIKPRQTWIFFTEQNSLPTHVSTGHHDWSNIKNLIF